MKNIVLRPLALFCITFFVSLCALTAFSVSAKIAVAAFFACAAVALAFAALRTKDNRMKHRTFFALCFFAAAMCLSALLSLYSMGARDAKIEKYSGESLDCSVTVTETLWDGGYSARYVARVTKADGKKESFGVVLTSDGGLPAGKTLSVKCAFSAFPEDTGESLLRYYYSKNVILCAESEDTPRAATGWEGRTGLVFSAECAAGRLNRFLTSVMTSSLGAENGSFASAILLGNRSELSDKVRSDFKMLGISHILALSGLHLSVLCAAVGAFLSRFGKKAQYGGMAGTVVFYMLLTGFSPSVTRAGLMLLTVIALSVSGLSSDGYTSLGTAVLFICLVSPQSAYDVGLQMSVAATFAVLMYSEAHLYGKQKLTEENIREKKEEKAYPFRLSAGFFNSLKMTVVVVLFLLPLSCLYAGMTSLAAPVTSVFYSLVATLLLWLLPFVLFFAPAPTFTAVISVVCGKIISFTLSTTAKIAALPGIAVSLKYPFAPFFCVLLFALVTAACISRKKNTRRRLVLSLVASVAAFAVAITVYNSFRPTSVIAVNTGKSDCTAVLSPSGNMIIDVSDGYTKALRNTASTLEDNGATQIDTVILSHLHNRYVTTLPSLLDKFRVRELVIPDNEEFTEAADALKAVAKRYGVSVVYFTPGETLSRCGVTVQTDGYTYIDRSSQPIVRFDISVDGGGKTFTYVSASYSDAFPAGELSADFVWLGSHGPKYSSEISLTFTDNTKVIASAAARSLLGTQSVSVSEATVLRLTG